MTTIFQSPSHKCIGQPAIYWKAIFMHFDKLVVMFVTVVIRWNRNLQNNSSRHENRYNKWFVRQEPHTWILTVHLTKETQLNRWMSIPFMKFVREIFKNGKFATSQCRWVASCRVTLICSRSGSEARRAILIPQTHKFYIIFSTFHT